MLFSINTDGTIDVSGVIDYELLVTTDDIVPNKKYVDDAIAGGGSATALGYLWTSPVVVQPAGTGSETVVIGEGAIANDAFRAIVIGNEALAGVCANRAIALGDFAECNSTNATAIGRLSKADHLSVALGNAAVALGHGGVAIAVSSTASGKSSVAIGRQAVADREGEITFGAASNITTFGDIRGSRFILFNETTDATQTELFVDNPATARMIITPDSAMTFKGLLTARRTDVDDESSGFKIEGVIDNNAGTVALVGAVSITAIGDDSGGTWLVSITADLVNAALSVKVTGEAAKTIRWACVLDTCEVIG